MKKISLSAVRFFYRYIFITYVFIFFVTEVLSSLSAFPGAGGYGANTRGAYGGSSTPVIFKVDSASSFRTAIGDSRPRVIIFTKGGTYDLGGSDPRIYSPYITIAGQTAPGGGVCFKNGALRVDANNVIVRGLKWRSGMPRSTGSNRDCIGIEGSGLTDIIIDHNSLSWASDEIACSWSTENRITWSWNIFSEGIGTHGYGLLAGGGCKNVSVHHNLYAHLVMRMPECNSGSTGEIINNVMYHWEGKATDFISGLQFWDVKNNYYKQKIDQADQKSIKIYWPGYNEFVIDTNSRFYIKGNIAPNRPNVTSGGEWDMVYLEEGGGNGSQYTGTMRANASVMTAPASVLVNEHTAEEAYKMVLKKVGATAPIRDLVDNRVINDVINSTGSRPDSVTESDYPNLDPGSYPADSDNDGIPDVWETERGLNPNNSVDAHNDRNGDGYTNLEEYINGCFQRDAAITANSLSIRSNGTDSSTVRIEIRNECDVIDEPYDKPVTFNIVNGIGKFSNNNQVSYTTNAVKGVATATLISDTVGVSSITVTPTGISGCHVNVLVYSNSIECSASPTSITADGTSKSIVTATIKDVNGNKLNTNEPVAFSVEGPGKLPGGVPVHMVNAVNGIATEEVTSMTTVGTIKVTVSFNGVIPASVNITANPSAIDPAAAKWYFDEGSGSIANDSSGNNNNGTLVNNPQWVNGMLGKALQFDGLGTFINVNDSNSLDVTTALSIEAWVKSNVITVDSGPTRRILDKGVYLLAASDQAYFKIYIGGIGKGVGKVWTQSDLGIWHHLVGTYDGINVKLYQDGVLAGQTAATGNIDVNGSSLVMGRQGTSASGRFDGLIDEIKIYSRALTQEEVLSRYQGTPIPPPPDNPPTVSITAPANNSTITGMLTISGTATDDHGINSVAFYIDDILKYTDTSTPYEYALDSAQYANGIHTIKAVVLDTNSQSANMQITVTFSNVIIDNLPTVSISSPTNNSTISKTVTISGNAGDDKGVMSVSFYVDNVLKNTDTTPPYTYSLDTTRYINGAHLIKLVAIDTISQTAIAQISVNVNNAALDNPPVVSIIAPVDNTVLSGSVTVIGTASDDNGVNSVAFFVDNVIKYIDTTAPYEYIFDTTKYSNGSHTIKFSATDAISQATVSQITVTIDNVIVDNLPTVLIIVPGEADTVFGNIAINATASDDNGIQNVCFYIDDIIISTSIASPYAYNLDTTGYSNGTHIIKAIATDTIAQTAIAQITININNLNADSPPTISITTPTANAIVSGMVTISAIASDNIGINRVCFYIDNIIISTDTTVPYIYNLNASQFVNGNHTIKAVATDTNAQNTSTYVNIIIDNALVDNPPSLVSIIAPANNSTVSGMVTISGTAVDDVGIQKVSFYINNALRNNDSTAPYGYTWDTTGYSNGIHTIKAVAIDTIAQTSITQITVTVNNLIIDNPPTVAITAPVNNATITGNVTVTASASDDNGITSVVFYVDDIVKSTDTSSPYTFTLDTIQFASGSHVLKAIATDTSEQNTSAQINFTIDNLPAVEIKSPANNSTVNGLVTISGTATDDNGIVSVAFYVDDILKSTSTTSPYTYNLDSTGYTNGTHTIKLIATNSIAQTTIAQITIIVDNIVPQTLVSLSPAINYLSIERLEGSKLQISWLSPESGNISKYNIYMSTGEMDYAIPVYTVDYPEHSKIIEGLTEEQEYKFVVRAVDNDGVEEKNTFVIAGTPVEDLTGLISGMAVPQSGMKITGERVTLAADINVEKISVIKELRFEYRRSDETEWQKILTSNSSHPNPDNSYPYFINWDVSGLDENYQYNVRVIIINKNGTEDTTAGYVTISLNSSDPDIEESGNYKRERIDNRRENIIIMGESAIDRLCRIKIPEGILNDSSTMIKIITNPKISAAISKGMVMSNGSNLVPVGYIHKIDLENGQSVFSKEIEISLPYNDRNNDNILDDQGISINKVMIYSYNEAAGKWEKLTNIITDTKNKRITCKTKHLSYYGLFLVLSSDLSASHVYPNPFKPSLGHTKVTFGNLTGHTKIRIFNTAGELVYEEEKDTPTGELNWDVNNSDGERVTSGVYIYMITNNLNQVKKGKLAIIR